MLCGYDNCQNEVRRERCNSCMRGIMILVGIIGGIIFAAAAVLLFINSLLTSAFTGVLIALITAIVFMFIILIGAFASSCGSKVRDCIRCNVAGLFIGILGTIAAGIIAVSTDLAAVSVLSAVLLGLTAFFFAYMLITVLFTVICVTDCRS